jgi:iron complex outermembrane receptor protein
MNARYPWKRATWYSILIAASMLPTAMAQQAAVSKEVKIDDATKLEKFVVTGSLIKRVEGEGALPMLTITPMEMEQRGIASAEQMIMELNINGNGMDNLASNADVVAGQQRGNNGATSANLRMQGSAATLVLLNGRRVAAHGLNGGTVDLNQIPFAAIERVEILKDGASATYGTDAVGGVINFITKSNYQGFSASAATDITQEGGGNIFRYSAVAGFGDLNKDRFNIMTTLSRSDHKPLRGDQRDWNGTFFPSRGLAPDTRGTPIATAFPLAIPLVSTTPLQPTIPLQNALSRDNLTAAGRGTGPIDPASGIAMSGGINILNLPGGAGFAGTDMQPYDYLLWSVPSAKYAAAWDTARAAVLQQPVRNTNSITRGIYKIGEHRLTGELVLGRSESTKSFSPQQFTSSATQTVLASDGLTTVARPEYNLAYPSTGADYNRVFNAIAAYFPSIAPNRGLPIAFRWRATPLGNREYFTRSDTWRGMVSLEGPISFLSKWEYRVGASRANSESFSILNHGYVYSVPFLTLINTGVVSPFSYTQTPEAMAAIDKTRADGVKLYGGRYTTDQVDASATGQLFKLPAGMVQAAIGVDHRKETWGFSGDQRPNLNTAGAIIASAAFDNANATQPRTRNIDAVFAELQIPIARGLDLNAAGRTDRYTGFGTSTNPKVTLRYAPSEKILFRSSYSTGFRVPTFTQQFNPRLETTYAGNDFADPANGPYNIVDATHPAVRPVIYTGGKLDLQPETAKMYSAGFVFQINRHLSGNVDWWSIQREGSILQFGQTVLAQNYELFKDRFIREAGVLTAIDSRWVNAGATSTKGIEYGLKGDLDVAGGRLAAGFDLSYLLQKKSKLLASAPFGLSEINLFTRSSDLGLRWKHTAFVSYRKGNWTAMVNQLYRNSYTDAVLPGVANGTVKPSQWSPTVKAYNIFGLSVTYRGIKNMTVIAGVKNLFNTDPPFSATYDTNTGAGSSWEPRIVDPRGRSFTLRVDYKYH